MARPIMVKTLDEFEEKVLKSETPVLVNYTAEW